MADRTSTIVRANSAPMNPREHLYKGQRRLINLPQRASTDPLHPISPNLPMFVRHEFGTTMLTDSTHANGTHLSGNYSMTRWLTDENTLEALRASAAQPEMFNTMNVSLPSQSDQSSSSSLVARATSATPSSMAKSSLGGAQGFGEMMSYLANVGSWREDASRSRFSTLEIPDHGPEDIVPLLVDVRSILRRMEAFLETLN